MKKTSMLLISWFALSLCVFGGDLTFKDPTGDDKGPGTYVYPTDAVYTQGSFDLTELQVSYEGDKVDFSVELNAKLDDPWGMGTGFAVQMVFIFIDTDGKAGSGHTEGLPGTNILFADDSAWDKVVILSPQKESRVISEARVKCPDWIDDIVVPNRTKGKGKKITGSVKLAELGGGDPATWGFQVVVQSNEGFPDKTDLLTRKVNEFEGQHRFGGGDDSDCDPHVMDILAGSAKGDAGEAQAQYDMLQYDCAGNKKATLHMVHAK